MSNAFQKNFTMLKCLHITVKSLKSTPFMVTERCSLFYKFVQSGRFGKLNKSVTFPETLNLSPYMSEVGDGMDTYKLYAVVVHVDMLNASYFGHYICYTKDLQGNWYKIDDCKVKMIIYFFHCLSILYISLQDSLSSSTGNIFSNFKELSPYLQSHVPQI